jgi:hypothetical protein
MRCLGLLLLVACSAPQQPPGAPPAEPVAPPVPPPPAPDMAVRASFEPPRESQPPPPPARIAEEPGNPDLKKLQTSLGAGVMTCFGTAKLLASQGTASKQTLVWREKTVLKLCVEDKWPVRLRECVASADHDQLACTSHLKTKRQRSRWNAAFTKWAASAGK